MKEQNNVTEKHVFLINAVSAPHPVHSGLKVGYGLAIVRDNENSLEIVQMDSSNNTQTLRLHVSQLEKLKEAIEMKLEMGVGDGR